MFIFVDGIPKSGKSYYSVNYMQENLDNYSKIYTNINGMKMTDKIRPLNFDKIKNIVLECYQIFQKASSELDENTEVINLDDVFIDYLLDINFLEKNPRFDNYINEKKRRDSLSYFSKVLINIRKPLVRETEYLRVLLVIDECYNYFEAKSSEKLLLWLISYHAHLFLDVILMSQSPEDINRAYQNRVNYFLHTMDSSRGIFNLKFRYQKHLKYPFNTNPKYGAYVGDIKIKKKDEVFKMYKAGDKGSTKSAVLPYIFLSVGILFFLLLLVYLIQAYAFGNSEKSESVPSEVVFTSNKQLNNNTSYIEKTSVSDTKYILFNCISESCSNKELKIKLDIEDLKFLVDNTDSKFLSTKKYSSNFGIVSLLASKDFLNLFQGANNGKDNTQGFSLIN
jgi:zona occludens toxin